MSKHQQPVTSVNPTNMALPFESGMPAYLQGNTNARGAENVGAADLIIPRLELVQSLSPARKKNDPAYIEGAEEGMLFNSVTRQLYGTEAYVVPVAYKKQWLVWKDRKKGGGAQGFRGAYDSEMDAKRAVAELSEEDLIISETPQHFCLIAHTSRQIPPEEIVLSMAVSKVKVSKRWNSLMRINGGDTFSRVYKISSVAEKNARGEEYFNFTISNAGYVPEELYRKAEALYSQFTQGNVIASHDYDKDEASTPASEEF